MKPHIVKKLVGALLVGLIIYTVPSILQIQSNHSQVKQQTSSIDLLQRIDTLQKILQELKVENAELKQALEQTVQISSQNSLTLSPDAADNINGTVVNASLMVPTLEYEKVRHQMERDMKELWYTIRGYAKKIGQSEFKQTEDIYTLLRSHLWKLRQEDGFEAFRERETKELSKIVQSRLYQLQNPPNCEKTKKFLCGSHKDCGFGCHVHNWLVYCMVAAYATGRVLVIDSTTWNYYPGGWEKVFLPASDTCTTASPNSSAIFSFGINYYARVWTHDHMEAPPSFMPVAIPSDIATRLEKVHGEPHTWWVGQFVKYLLRMQPETQKAVEEVKIRLNMSLPTVGIHVRRGNDMHHSLADYMLHVNEYFSIREKYNGKVKKRVFIATDDPSVISEAYETYNGTEWEIIGNVTAAESATGATRYKYLMGIITDVFMLAECDFLVCTFSSNICRMAYEIMQTKQADASGRFVSLDSNYFFIPAKYSGPVQVAEFAHKARNPSEIDLEVGDVVKVSANRWNGMTMGANIRTIKTGLFPSYKARAIIKKIDFPILKWWNQSGEVGPGEIW